MIDFFRSICYTRLYCKIYDFAMLGNFIAERRQSRQSRRTYCPRKVFDFAAAFGGVANNFVVCNRGQYNMDNPGVQLSLEEQRL